MSKLTRLFFSIIPGGLSLALLAFSVACQAEADNSPALTPQPQALAPSELVIYAYDSFVSEWGPGPVVIPLFEKATGCKVTLLGKGDAGQMLSALVLEGDKPRWDVAIGIDNNLLPKALEADVFQPYESPALAAIPAQVQLDPGHRVSPYDYGYFALVADTQKLATVPGSLEDLCKPEYAGKLILMDPRTSSPGLGFLAMVLARYGSDWPAYWQRLAPSILTISSGWDAGYGLFTQGEAPLVISYTTSPAYHVEYDKTERYKALVFEEGQTMQIEGAGIAKNAAHPDLARKFIDFMLGQEFQAALPLTQWMYPVHPGVTLPESYKAAPRASTVVWPDPVLLTQALDIWAGVAGK